MHFILIVLVHNGEDANIVYKPNRKKMPLVFINAKRIILFCSLKSRRNAYIRRSTQFFCENCIIKTEFSWGV